MQDVLKEKVAVALKSLGIEDVEPVIEFPAELSHGDYATNAALAGAKAAGENPRELAEKIVGELGDIEHISKIEIAGPGFINFHLSRDYFAKAVSEADEHFGKNASLQSKKILLEKSAPNLFKPFHIGHLVNISIGESLSRLMRFSGGDVTDVAYPSDISLGVAKAVWALIDKGIENELTINALGEAYVYGTQKFDEDESVKERVIAINKKLNAKESGDEWDVYQKGRELNLAYFKRITARLGSEFSDYFFESEAGEVGKVLVENHTGRVFKESEGAVIFPGEEYGLHTRVFLTSNKIPVYETKDIGLLKLKFEKYDPDFSILLTDVEQKQYFEVIKKAAELINPEWADRSTYWQHGRLRLEGGKISSRYGNVPLAEDLIEKVKEIILEKKPDTESAVAEQVAIASLKYAFLRSGSGKNIVFDFEKSVSIEGDSGPYLQYSYARAKSVLEKGAREQEAGHIPETVPAFERLLPRFPVVVERAAREYEPHYVTTYLTELASSFNSWYAQERIIGSPDEAYKLVLTRAFAQTMKNGLWLLGIEAPEKM
jgi:arginyl-tRNA synthetase